MVTKPKEYTGTCYIGVVGGDHEIGECRDSIESIYRRPGDERPLPIRATKGYEGRSLHMERWLAQGKHEFCLLLDHDMLFQVDTLERLRSHKLPYVSGYYMRRRYAPIAPVWFEYGPRGVFPLKPWTTDPERGKLHKLGASGWGCVLLHRDVALAVQGLLKGEPFIAEDDMDVWPYDLNEVMQALHGLRTLTTEKPSVSTLRPALEAHVSTLEREWKVLRGVKDPVGSDLRFPFFAREAGYTLMGDPDVRPGHVVNYPMSPDDFSATPPEILTEQATAILKGFGPERQRIAGARKALKGVA